MIRAIFASVASFIINLISTAGYAGIVLAMAIESACIPLPSEIIMPFSGYLVSQGTFALWPVALAGAIGNVIGSLAVYVAGYLGGRSFILKYGKYLLVTVRDVEIADRWFSRYGQAAIFLSRLTPIVRTFISLPAGISRMPLLPFLLYTFVGSYLWAWGLAWGGMKLGEHWTTLGGYFHKFDFVIATLILAGVISWAIRHLRHEKH